MKLRLETCPTRRTSLRPRRHRRHGSRSAHWWTAGAALVFWSAPVPVRAGDYASSLELGIASEAADSYSTERFFQAAYRYAPGVPGRAGLDFSLSVLAPAYVVVLPELDLTYAVPLGRNTFAAPRVGATIALAGSSAYSMALPGVNAGMGLVVLGEKGNGMRMDVNVRRFGLSSRDHEYLVSASVGYVFSPR